LGLHSELGTRQTRKFMDARQHPRYRLEVAIRVYPRNASVVRGNTVDISESGISAMLRVEVPVGEVVRLEFDLPDGLVEAHAMVRQRNAFRYGMQFVDSGSVHAAVSRTCAQLAMEQSLRESKL
jgi:PilZ domain